MIKADTVLLGFDGEIPMTGKLPATIEEFHIL